MKKICTKYKAKEVVIGFSDVLLETCVCLCNELTFNWYVSKDTLNIVRNKVLRKGKLFEFQIIAMKHTTLAKHLAPDEVEESHFPVVIKPIDGYGSGGLLKVNSIPKLRSYFDQVIYHSKQQEKIILEQLQKGKYIVYLLG